MTNSWRALCLNCRAVTENVHEDDKITGCPACGDQGVPANADETVTLTLTKHELRVLTIWASSYAAQGPALGYPNMPRVAQGILDEIGRYTDAALSLQQEISDVRQAFPESDVRVYRDGKLSDL